MMLEMQISVMSININLCPSIFFCFTSIFNFWEVSFDSSVSWKFWNKLKNELNMPSQIWGGFSVQISRPASKSVVLKPCLLPYNKSTRSKCLWGFQTADSHNLYKGSKLPENWTIQLNHWIWNLLVYLYWGVYRFSAFKSILWP